MNEAVSYREVLASIRAQNGIHEVAVISNLTLEPVFGDYLRYYGNVKPVAYYDVNTSFSLHQNESHAIVFVDPATMFSDIAAAVFIYSEEEFQDANGKITSRLSAYLDNLCLLHKHIVFFTFFLDCSVCRCIGIKLSDQ